MNKAEDVAAIAPLRVLVVDDEVNIRVTLSMCLEADGHVVVAHDNIHDALAEAAARAFDLVFLDVRLDADDGLDFLPRLRAESPWAKVVVITAYASVATAIKAMKRGAAEYLAKPFTPDQVRMVVQKVADQRRLEWRLESLQQALGNLDPEADFPTASAAMLKALDVARRVAASRATVLITGEVGTGKGRVARAIHAWSGRPDAPFGVAFCQTGPPDAINAEIFGASRPEALDGPPENPGRVALCAGGTLVLEEVGELPPSLQPKLLQLLADKQYERLHDYRLRSADVRIVATSSSDLGELVQRRRFRPDLLLALDVVRVEIPPLRDRPEDIDLLAKRYLAFFGRENRRAVVGFTRNALHALRQYAWPGNARELRNLVERAVLLCDADLVDLEHFPPNLLNATRRYEVGDLVSLEAIQQAHVRRVVETSGTLRGAAAILGINEKTVRSLLRRSPDGGGSLAAETVANAAAAVPPSPPSPASPPSP